MPHVTTATPGDGASVAPAVQAAQAFFDQLNRDYVAVHKRKEDLFWATYMATSEDHEGFGRAETDYKAFISDPETLRSQGDSILLNLDRHSDLYHTEQLAAPARVTAN